MRIAEHVQNQKFNIMTYASDIVLLGQKENIRLILVSETKSEGKILISTL